MKAITRAQNGTGATSDQALHWIGTCPAPEVGTSLDDILSMRVGCWRPPVYVKHRPDAPDLGTPTVAGTGTASATQEIEAIRAVTC
jgi:hypothetical protein